MAPTRNFNMPAALAPVRATAPTTAPSSPKTVIVVNREALIHAACVSGTFNPFELSFAAYNTAIDAGLDHSQAPVVAAAILTGVNFDSMAAATRQNAPTANAPPPRPLSPSAGPSVPTIAQLGRRPAQDLVCALSVPEIERSLKHQMVTTTIESGSAALLLPPTAIEETCYCCECLGCRCDDGCISQGPPSSAVPPVLPSQQQQQQQQPRVQQRRRSFGSGRYIIGSKPSLMSSLLATSNASMWSSLNEEAAAAATAAAAAAASLSRSSATFACMPSSSLWSSSSSVVRTVPLRRLARRPSKPYAPTIFFPRISVPAV